MNDLSPTSIRPAARVARTTLSRPPAVSPGIVLGGKYRLEVAIAQGGMARVWRAMHMTLNQPVAVKFLDSVEATRTASFLHEAKVAASVRNKHVVSIIDFGVLEVPGGEAEPYMVMELLDGETLDDRLRRPGMPVEEAISIGLQVLSGLDAVHEASIVHRDMKPGNIFLTHDNEGVFARLLDFGISQDVDEVDEAHLVVGTPEYMSPEQARGAALDYTSDIYSLGVVLYEMLSGAVPFHDDNVRTVVALVATELPTPLHTVRPDIPELAAIVERAMGRTPADRWGSALEMRLALLEVKGRGHLAPRESQSGLSTAHEGPHVHGDTPTLGVAGSASERARFDAIIAPPSVMRPAARIALALSLVVAATLAMGWVIAESHRGALAPTPAVTSARTPIAAAALAPAPPASIATDTVAPSVALPAVTASGIEAPEVVVPARAPRRARVIVPRPPAPTIIRHELDF